MLAHVIIQKSGSYRCPSRSRRIPYSIALFPDSWRKAGTSPVEMAPAGSLSTAKSLPMKISYGQCGVRSWVNYFLSDVASPRGGEIMCGGEAGALLSI